MTAERPWLSRTEDHLREALDTDDPSRKNYHIRAALQQVSVRRRQSEE